MESKKELEKITFRIGSFLNVARANFILYCLIAKNVDQLKNIKGLGCLGNIQNNAKIIFSLEIHKAYALPQESKKEVASFGYVVSMLKKNNQLNINIDKKHETTLIEYCNKFITYDKSTDIVNNVIKSYTILKKKKMCDLEKLKKVRHEFIAHSTLEQIDLKGPKLIPIKELISDGIQFAQILYLMLWGGTLDVLSENEYLEQGKSFLQALGLKNINYFDNW